MALCDISRLRCGLTLEFTELRPTPVSIKQEACQCRQASGLAERLQ